MEHYKESRYDDDLTVGIDEYDEDFSTADIDLFEYIGDEESPLARLKSTILSIDWEINDEILRQFNDELKELKSIWKDEKINLVYIQALEKLCRYIYKERSSAHPNAIKLLLTLYTNLEKIVSEESLSSGEKKKILIADVQRFERLKKVIVPSADQASAEPKIQKPKVETVKEPLVETIAEEDVADEYEHVAAFQKSEDKEKGGGLLGEVVDDDLLLNLKAVVYGIDWEVTDRDLSNLQKEVNRLQKEFQGGKAKQIFLQGIGSLGQYISLKRSNAHADAFRLLHSFYAGLEKVVRESLTGQEEKDVLLPEVEKFNAFKGTIAEAMASGAAKKVEDDADEDAVEEELDIKPAFADIPIDVDDFQEKEEDELQAVSAVAGSDEYKGGDDLEYEDDRELAGEMESRLEGMFDEPGLDEIKNLSADVALAGVDVEMEADDDSDEEPLPLDGDGLAPALSTEDDLALTEESPAVFADHVEDFFENQDEEEGLLGQPVAESDGLEEDIDAEKGQREVSLDFEAHGAGETAESSAKDTAIQGVDVETEDDDDSGEAPLPMDGDELAPALSFGDDEEARSGVRRKPAAGEKSPEIDDNLEAFFGDDAGEEVHAEDVASMDEAELEDLYSEDYADLDVEVDDGDEADEGDDIKRDVDDKLSDFFIDEDVAKPSEEEILSGVDVETEADDDSEEVPLPMDGDELVPALGGDDSEEAVDEEFIAVESEEEGDDDALADISEDETPQGTPAADVDEEEVDIEFFDDQEEDEGDELVDFEDHFDAEPAEESLILEEEADTDDDEFLSFDEEDVQDSDILGEIDDTPIIEDAYSDFVGGGHDEPFEPALSDTDGDTEIDMVDLEEASLVVETEDESQYEVLTLLEDSGDAAGGVVFDDSGEELETLRLIDNGAEITSTDVDLEQLLFQKEELAATTGG